jgi:hypothetical protein
VGFGLGRGDERASVEREEKKMTITPAIPVIIGIFFFNISVGM